MRITALEKATTMGKRSNRVKLMRHKKTGGEEKIDALDLIRLTRRLTLM